MDALTYLLHAPETRVVVAIGGFVLGVAVAALLVLVVDR